MTDVNEELRQVRAALAAANRQLAEQGQTIAELRTVNENQVERAERAWEQIELMRHSISWQLTAPLRRMKRRIR
ncbi:hypothetical protein [Actinomyces vulturis]|uniref:hypothetical protein n=1 Tax=Actinomyces vulturis TaxID=1857645 RepID=UPI0008315B42|nr:hypothetical protein [Actinomyces vulturis]